MIIFTVPLALIGVVVGLLVTGQSFNVMSLIGLVVLVGIVMNDAVDSPREIAPSIGSQSKNKLYLTG